MKRSNIERSLLLATIIVLLSTIIFRLADPHLHHGDNYSDVHVIVSSHNFNEKGFINLQFLPRYALDCTEDDVPYVTLPPGPNLLAATIHKIFQTDSLISLRIMGLISAVLSIATWYFIVLLVSKNRLLAILAAFFHSCSPLFISYSDSLWFTPLCEVLRNTTLLFWILLKKRDNYSMRSPYMWLAFGSFALSFWFDPAYIPFTALILFFDLAHKVIKKEFSTSRAISFLGIMAIAPLLSLFIHILQDLWYFGSWEAMSSHLTRRISERIADSPDSSQALNLTTWIKYVLLRQLQMAFGWGWEMIILLLLISTSLLPAKQESLSRKNTLQLITLLGLCSIIWFLLFPAHSLAHAFLTIVARYPVSFAATITALALYNLYGFLGNKARWTRLLWLIAVLTLGSFHFAKSDLPCTTKGAETSTRFAGLRNFMEYSGTIIPATETVGINWYRYPAWEFYVDRRMEFMPTKDLISTLPKFYIYVHLGHSEASKLIEQGVYQVKHTSYEWFRPLFLLERTPFPKSDSERKSLPQQQEQPDKNTPTS